MGRETLTHTGMDIDRFMHTYQLPTTKFLDTQHSSLTTKEEILSQLPKYQFTHHQEIRFSIRNPNLGGDYHKLSAHMYRAANAEPHLRRWMIIPVEPRKKTTVMQDESNFNPNGLAKVLDQSQVYEALLRTHLDTKNTSIHADAQLMFLANPQNIFRILRKSRDSSPPQFNYPVFTEVSLSGDKKDLRTGVPDIVGIAPDGIDIYDFVYRLPPQEQGPQRERREVPELGVEGNESKIKKLRTYEENMFKLAAYNPGRIVSRDQIRSYVLYYCTIADVNTVLVYSTKSYKKYGSLHQPESTSLPFHKLESITKSTGMEDIFQAA